VDRVGSNAYSFRLARHLSTYPVSLRSTGAERALQGTHSKSTPRGAAAGRGAGEGTSHASPGRRRLWRRRLPTGRLHQGWTHVCRRPWRCSASCWTCATSPLPCSTASRRYGTYHRARLLTRSLSSAAPPHFHLSKLSSQP
jgi:hypothetical protein